MFEIIARDGAGRIGKLRTTHGYIYTPEFMPVYNHNHPTVPIDDFRKMNVKILITNAYIINRTPKLKDNAEKGIHNLINFNNLIMTDSGAYQAWMYQKELEITNKEIINFQDLLKPDIATILDIFTETNSYSIAKEGVKKTIESAEECIKIRKKDSKILWAAPIQGGQFLDLLEYCAKELSKLDFDFHPLGTLAPALVSYNFKKVAETIAVTKKYMTPSRPLHAFSIGHPIFFSLAVALGADLFDSSSYALFAKNNRYLTVNGTLRLENLITEFPCSCPICLKFTPEDLKSKENPEREKLLAQHNLYVCLEEMKRIRLAIREGNLWNLVQIRIQSHPRLIEAYNYVMSKYLNNLELFEPISKHSAIFITDSSSLNRPEVFRYHKNLEKYYKVPKNVKYLILLPDLRNRLYFDRKFQNIQININKITKKNRSIFQICLISPIFGIIPEELQEIYPLSQFVYSQMTNKDFIFHSQQIIERFIIRHKKNYEEIVLYRPKELIMQDLNKSLLDNHTINKISTEIKVAIVNDEVQLYEEIEKLYNENRFLRNKKME
ncbi:MAG: tRNA guanosine(15) transglycosylase TgtA [Candidatus Helarchaeota archaeon]|nr:tRNA guanosine(15) transglycosylase TgtA [Candidatus Helarchaeota archaeon]